MTQDSGPNRFLYLPDYRESPIDPVTMAENSTAAHDCCNRGEWVHSTEAKGKFPAADISRWRSPPTHSCQECCSTSSRNGENRKSLNNRSNFLRRPRRP